MDPNHKRQRPDIGWLPPLLLTLLLLMGAFSTASAFGDTGSGPIGIVGGIIAFGFAFVGLAILQTVRR